MADNFTLTKAERVELARSGELGGFGMTAGEQVTKSAATVVLPRYRTIDVRKVPGGDFRRIVRAT